MFEFEMLIIGLNWKFELGIVYIIKNKQYTYFSFCIPYPINY